MESRKKYSIRSRMIGMVMLCWCVPVLLTLGVIGHYVFGNQLEHKINAQLAQLISDDQMSAERLDSLVKTAREVTYDGEIERAFTEYREKKRNKRSLLEISGSYLKRAFDQNINVKDMILWFHEEPMKMYCEMYNKSSEGSYHEVNEYWDKDHTDIAAYAGELDTAIGFYRNEDRLYLVRNLLDCEYRPIAVLVIRMNQDYCFDKISNYPAGTDVTVRLNSCQIPVQGKEVKDEVVTGKRSVSVSGHMWADRQLMFFHKMEGNGYWLETYLRFADSSVFVPFYGYQFIIVGTLVFALPLLLLCLRIFKRHMAKPMDAMVEGAKAIERGAFGYQIEEQPESVEFSYLIETFNQMSRKIQEQFTKIYEEEVALRDAKIMALQSHINPHFLNNTLEIINWEARMGENEKVSQMIEALATLMDATIDRKRRPEVLLSEEMEYVNAYLCIVSRRFGSRLEVVNDIPDEILSYEVPRLILQPIIENAIEHGVAKRRHGVVRLTGYKEGRYLYLEITNDSVLTKEMEEKIERLLDMNYDIRKESSGNVGIANVNQRLRILYGEPCGLTICMRGEAQVVSRLVILAEKEGKKNQ